MPHIAFPLMSHARPLRIANKEIIFPKRIIFVGMLFLYLGEILPRRRADIITKTMRLYKVYKEAFHFICG